ncbi:ribonuclease domain-containing protein [Lysobacter niastensis]|uniref:Ribonuclease n=1 Tax=Lysobacter niastensis TaxID=380629 RepID=A0ABS0B3W7_9GAMM|nr:ribonuclease domain-containing protein [Lysobacter niastensis]MBF6023185.1 ribonuclease [Lysobacter niastensis]
MRRRHLWLIAIIVLLGLWLWSRRLGHGATPDTSPPQGPSPSAQVADAGVANAPMPERGSRYPSFLPVEAHAVLDRIASGGPHPHRQDGNVFQNREKRLPPQPRGYYHEYTVDTPGSDDRGARRIVTGGDPPVEYWYTSDHYQTFRQFDVTGPGPHPSEQRQ